MRVEVKIKAGEYLGNNTQIVKESPNCKDNVSYLSNLGFFMIHHATPDGINSTYLYLNNQIDVTAVEALNLLSDMPHNEDILSFKVCEESIE